MKHLLPLMGLLLLIGCDALGGKGSGADAPVPQEQAVPVRVAVTAPGQLVRSLELGGVASADRSARIAPTGQGVIRSLKVELGQKVKKGELLAELDVSTLSLQLDQARSSAQLARLQAQDTRQEAARVDMLQAEGAASSQQIDKMAMGLQLADAQVAQAEASLAVLENQIAKARLTAPFAGTVTGVFLEEGEFFTGMAGMGGPPALVALESLDPIRLDVHVPDVDLARVEQGMRVLITSGAFPGRQWEGEIALINAVADVGARTFTVRIRVPNEDGALRPGLFLTARLVLEQQEDVLAIPEKAISEPDSAEPFVMVVEGSTARRKAVQPGLRGDSGWAVGGLTAGEQVVVEGHFGLPDGAHVRVID
jgi:membrane fusion protein (multidrug efflux system)